MMRRRELPPEYRRKSVDDGPQVAKRRNFRVGELLLIALNVGELRIEFGEALLHIGKIVGDAGNLCGGGFEARAGIGLHILHRFLDAGQRDAEFVIRIGLLLDESFQHGEICAERSGGVLLRLLDIGGAVEQLDDFFGRGADGGRREKRSADCSTKHACTEHENHLTTFSETSLICNISKN